MPPRDSDQPKRQGPTRKFVGQRGQLNKQPVPPETPLIEDGQDDLVRALQLELTGDKKVSKSKLKKLVAATTADEEEVKKPNRRERRATKLHNWREEFGKEEIVDETDSASSTPSAQQPEPPNRTTPPVVKGQTAGPTPPRYRLGPPLRPQQQEHRVGPPPTQQQQHRVGPPPTQQQQHRLGPPPTQQQQHRLGPPLTQQQQHRVGPPPTQQHQHRLGPPVRDVRNEQMDHRDQQSEPPRHKLGPAPDRRFSEGEFQGRTLQQQHEQEQRIDERGPDRRRHFEDEDSRQFAPHREMVDPNQPPVEVGQELRVGLQSITMDGECIARIQDYVIYVAEGIPGEFVDIQIVSVGREFARARVRKVATRDRFRVTPKCRHFGVCGGCQWQHIDYPSQLHWKEKLLAASLEHSLPKIRFPIRPMISVGEPWSTRNKIYYQVGWFVRGESSQLLLGHNRLHAPTLEPISECPVHHQSGDRVARLAFQVIRERGIPISDAMSVKPGVKGILVRTSGSTGLSQVVVVATGTFLPGSDGFEEQILKVRGVDGVHLNIQADPESTYLGKETIHLAGVPRLVEDISDVKFHVSPDAFFQTNHRAAQALYDVVYRMVSEQRCNPILDLYSGVGLFALPLAKRGRTVVAVEENETAVADGIETARLNDIKGCHFIANRVERAIKELPRERKFHTVILDPPREGCMEWVLRLIGRGLRPKRIVYVSCNPTALGRDLVMLMQSGYRVDEIQPVDMFPHTPHIESVTLLNRK